jgi:hypothetical protein
MWCSSTLEKKKKREKNLERNQRATSDFRAHSVDIAKNNCAPDNITLAFARWKSIQTSYPFKVVYLGNDRKGVELHMGKFKSRPLSTGSWEFVKFLFSFSIKINISQTYCFAFLLMFLQISSHTSLSLCSCGDFQYSVGISPISYSY